MRSSSVWLLLGLLSSLPLSAADDPISADRPNITNSTYTLAPRRLELEGGYTYSSSGGTTSHALGQLYVRVGVLSNLDAHVSLNSYTWTHAPGARTTGFEDLHLGGKWRFRDVPEKTGWRVPGMALLVGTTLPTGRSTVGNATPQPNATLAADLNLSDRLYLAANVGASLPKTSGKRYGTLNASVSPSWTFSPRLSAYTEVFGEFGHGRSCYLDGGLVYNLSRDFQLDSIVGQGFNGAHGGDFFVGFGGTWRGR